MARRPELRQRELSATLATLASHGLKPLALDALPRGGFRLHLSPPQGEVEELLDQELRSFQAKHDQG